MNAGDIVAHLKAKVDEFKAGIKVAKDELNGLRGNVDAQNRKLADAGKKMTMYITAPILGMGAMAVRTAATFEQAMNKVRAITGATGAEFEALKNKAMEMGRTTKYTANESADALSFLGMAGFNAAESMEALPGVLQLAAAGNMDLATTADYVSNILTGYGMQVSELGHLNDVLARTFTTSNTNMSQLAEAMKYVGPVAAGMGMQIEETAAAIGMLGDAGIQGSMAGTTLRQAMIQLMAGGGRAEEAIERLGLVTKDSTGQFVGMVSIIEQLETAGASTADMLDLFGARGAGMIAMVSQGSEKFKEFITDLENAGGTAERIAEIQMEGLIGSWTKFKSALEGALIVVGNQLLPMLTDLADRATGWIQAFAEMDDTTIKFIMGIALVVAALGPMIYVYAKVKMAMMAYAAQKAIVAAATVKAAAAMGAAGSATVGFGGKLALLGPKLAAALGPLMMFAAAVYGSYQAIKWLGTEMEKGMVTAQQVWENQWGDITAIAVSSQNNIIDSQLKMQQESLAMELERLIALEESANEASAIVDEKVQHEVGSEEWRLAEIERITEELIALEQEAANRRLLAAELTRVDLAMAIEDAEGQVTESVLSAIQARRDALLGELDQQASDEIAAVIDKYAAMEEIDFDAFGAEIAALKEHFGNKKAEIDAQIAEEVALEQAKSGEIQGIYQAHTGEILSETAAMGQTLAEYTEDTGFTIAGLWHQNGSSWVERLQHGLFPGRDKIREEMGMIGNAGVAEGYRYRGQFEAVGGSMGDGIKVGLWSRITQIATAAGEVVKAALRSARNTADARSPSVKTTELGEDMGTGLVIGVRNKAAEFAAEMREFVSGAMAVPEFALDMAGGVGISVNQVVNHAHSGSIRVISESPTGKTHEIVDIIIDELRQEVR